MEVSMVVGVLWRIKVSHVVYLSFHNVHAYIVEFMASAFNGTRFSRKDIGSKNRRESSCGEESSNNRTRVNHCR
jgi:hypothetical protein